VVVTDILRALLLSGVVLYSWKEKRTFGLGKKQGNELEGRQRRTFSFAACLAIGTMILVFWYTLSSSADYFYTRYFIPLTLISIPLFAAVLSRMVKRWNWLLISCGFLAAVPVGGMVFLAHSGLGFKGTSMLREQLPLVAELVPENQWVAAAQSGTLGFMRERVVNLDGRVNFGALRRQEDMWRYLDERGIRWVCDWDMNIRTYLGDSPEDLGWIFVARRGEMLLYHRGEKQAANRDLTLKQ
jgi:hypothetical protein